MPEKRAKMDNKMDMRAVACVLLAAGAGSRFGGGKLLAEFGGERLFERAMNVLPKELFSRVAVVSGCEDILAESERRGFLAVRNSAPEKGVSLSVRLGLEAAKPCSAVLFLVCDQPLLRKESVRGAPRKDHRAGRSGRAARQSLPVPGGLFSGACRARGGPRRKARHPRSSGGGFDRSAAGGRALRHRHKRRSFAPERNIVFLNISVD